jgi:transposase
MLRRHEEGLLNYYPMPINNNILQGLNNKAKVINDKAHEYRSGERHIQNLHHCMAGLPLPQTVHSFA